MKNLSYKTIAILIAQITVSKFSLSQIGCGNNNWTSCNFNDYVGWANTESIPLRIKTNTAYPIEFYTNGTQYMTLLGSTNPGYLGIGITTPNYLIHQDGGTGNATYHQFTNGSTSGTTSTDGLLVGITSTGNAELNQQKNAPMNFLTNNAARLKIQSDGKVALGNYTTFTANSLLHQYVNSATETYHQFTNSTTGASSGTSGLQVGIDANGNAIFKNNYSSGSNGTMNFYTNAAERMTIKADGKVGVNVTSPQSQFEVDAPVQRSTNTYLINDQTGQNLGASIGVTGLQINTKSGNANNVAYGIFNEVTGPANVYGVYASLSNATTSTSDVMGMFNELSGSSSTSNLKITGNSNRINYGNQYADAIKGSTVQLCGYSNSAIGNEVSFIGTTGISNGVKVNLIGTTTSGTPSSAGYFLNNNTGSNNYGIEAYASNGGTTNYAVYAAVNTNCTQTSGCSDWAGYFAGSTYSTGTYLGSDVNIKTNINDISGARNIINSLEPKSFYFDPIKADHLNLPDGIHYGFIAQNVETILPNCVRQTQQPAKSDNQGNVIYPDYTFKSVNYIELIPLLTMVVKEQQQQIDSLITALLGQPKQNNLNQSDTKDNSVNQLKVSVSNSKVIYLSQNIPNPFVDNTTISFSIPAEVKTAQIIFTENNGVVLKSIDITQRGESSLTVFGENLSKGIYSYSLIVDGTVFETKKMVKQ